ncbi:hypothetical protein GUJ93_ZPchr0005g14661 [Zizania palustris]|uniref:Uncharacterized protein n=1 Tax=Zizania palustris TaxID=103762 RepID=A0A8J5T549_ZIZPA|nr:hypothetical protein GUJ93_ZPchr0005g14661 [Zizania palustris]
MWPTEVTFPAARFFSQPAPSFNPRFSAFPSLLLFPAAASARYARHLPGLLPPPARLPGLPPPPSPPQLPTASARLVDMPLKCLAGRNPRVWLRRWSATPSVATGPGARQVVPVPPYIRLVGSLEEAMRILEQGASNLQGGGEGSAEAVGMLMLTMSTLLYRRGRRQDAMEKLKATQQLLLLQLSEVLL